MELEKVVGLTGFVIIHVFIVSFSPAQGERNQMVNTKFTRSVNGMPMSTSLSLNLALPRVEFVAKPGPGVEGDEVGAGLEGGAAGRVALAPRHGKVLGARSPGGFPIAGPEGGLKSFSVELGKLI